MHFQREEFAHLSFEFFPPQSSRAQINLLRTAGRLQAYQPDFFTVTHGAGASSREGTKLTVQFLREQGFNAIPHVSWGNDSDEEITQLVRQYQDMGVEHLVVLRGDKRPEEEGQGSSRYAEDLVRLIRTEFKDHFGLHVACYPEMHPEAKSLDADVENLQRKVQAGSDLCITQYFFNPNAYMYFVQQCRDRGMDADIVPGLMPISNYEKLVDFSVKCGAEIPRWLDKRLQDLVNTPDELRSFGASVVAQLVQTLMGSGAPGFHFYTLNLARPTQLILDQVFN